MYYTGKRAAEYEDQRKGDPKWDFERKTLKTILESLKIKSVLDIAVGTGRFFDLYPSHITGVDCSPDMLAIAKKRAPHAVLKLCDLLVDPLPATADLVVCFRFLNLISTKHALSMLDDLLAASRKYAVFTMRTLPDTSISLGRVTVHPLGDVLSVIAGAGFKVVEVYPYEDNVDGVYAVYFCQKLPKPRKPRNASSDIPDDDTQSD